MSRAKNNTSSVSRLDVLRKQLSSRKLLKDAPNNLICVNSRMHSWYKVLPIVGIFLILVLLVYIFRGINLTKTELKELRKTLDYQLVSQAWEILNNPSTGNSGKVEAFNTLLANKVSLSGVDLSCVKMRIGWRGEPEDCTKGAYLIGLDMGAKIRSENVLQNDIKFDPSSKYFDPTRKYEDSVGIVNIDLSGADLSLSNFTGASMTGASFKNTRLVGANFTDAMLWYVDFEAALLARVNFENSNLHGANMSKAQFCIEKLCAYNLTGDQIRQTWALTSEWNPDNLPPYLKVGEASNWPSPRLCSTALQDQDGYYQRTESGLPVGC